MVSSDTRSVVEVMGSKFDNELNSIHCSKTKGGKFILHVFSPGMQMSSSFINRQFIDFINQLLIN